MVSGDVFMSSMALGGLHMVPTGMCSLLLAWNFAVREFSGRLVAGRSDVVLGQGRYS
jgi:hypothetical protein